jgi:hypothetical protein
VAARLNLWLEKPLEPAIGDQPAEQRQGAADRGEYRQAAGIASED